MSILQKQLNKSKPKYTISNSDSGNAYFFISIPQKKGSIGFRSETTEIFYPNIEIKEIDKIIPMEELL